MYSGASAPFDFYFRGPCRAALDRAKAWPALESALSRQAPNLCYSETGHIFLGSPTPHTPHVERAPYPPCGARSIPPHVERAPYPPCGARTIVRSKSTILGEIASESPVPQNGWGTLWRPKNRLIRPNTRMELAPCPPCGTRSIPPCGARTIPQRPKGHFGRNRL